MRWFSSIFVALFLLAFVSCEKKPPLISFSQTEIDLGTMATNDAIHTYDVEFTNEGNDDLVIQAVFPSCECVTVECFDTITSGGKKGAIHLRYNFSIYPPGDIERSITVTSNSSDTIRTEVFLHAKLKYAD